MNHVDMVVNHSMVCEHHMASNRSDAKMDHEWMPKLVDVDLDWKYCQHNFYSGIRHDIVVVLILIGFFLFKILVFWYFFFSISFWDEIKFVTNEKSHFAVRGINQQWKTNKQKQWKWNTIFRSVFHTQSMFFFVVVYFVIWLKSEIKYLYTQIYANKK